MKKAGIVLYTTKPIRANEIANIATVFFRQD